MVSGCRKYLVCATATAVAFGWGAGGSLIIPHLMDELGLSAGAASLVYLANPLAGLPLQPLLGAKSDSYRGVGRRACGRRRPFVLALGALAALGLSLLVWSDGGALRRGWSQSNQIAFAFTVYAAVDLANDFLMVPGRALAIDVLGASASTDAAFSTMQGSGRLLALVLGALPLERVAEELSGAPSVTQFQALFGLNVAVVVLCVALAVVASGREPAYSAVEEGEEGDEEEEEEEEADLTSRTSLFEGQQAEPIHLPDAALPLLPLPRDGDPRDGDPLSLSLSPRRRAAFEAKPATSSHTAEECEAGLLAQVRLHWAQLDGLQRRGMFSLLTVQMGGWINIMCLAMWATQWLGLDTPLPGPWSLRLPYIAMALQAAVGLGCTALLLPGLHRAFGAARTYLIGELLLAACLAVSPALGRERPYATLAVFGLSGVGWAVHNTSAFVLCRAVARAPRAVAFFVSLVCTTLAAAQVLVGAFSGSAVQLCGNNVATMQAWAGSLVFLTDLAVLVASERSGVFPRDRGDALAEKLLRAGSRDSDSAYMRASDGGELLRAESAGSGSAYTTLSGDHPVKSVIK
jgi:solute carrier family 45 protein 1/2/4